MTLSLLRVGERMALIILFVATLCFGSQSLAHADEDVIPTPDLPSACSDGIDNDGDGLIDFVPIFGDPGCTDIFGQSEDGGSGGGGGDGPAPTTQCNDGIDNDGDGLTDFLPTLGDPDCDNFSDDSETAGGGGGGSATACSDGLDNDNDGKVDSADPGCSDATDTDETDPAGGGGNPPSGGGGGPAPACEDNIDNDLDGLKDMQDPGCENAADTDETNGSGGGGGGGTSELQVEPSTAEGEVLGAATPNAESSCDTYLTAFLRFGADNDRDQVTKLQKVLKDFESAGIEETGTYDIPTLNAVHALQTKYADEILAPWGIQRSTGYVYLTTRKKVNEIRCENKVTFPLTAEESLKLESAKVESRSVIENSAISVETVKLAPVAKPVAEESEAKDKMDSVEDEAGDETAIRERGLNRIWDFIGRMLNRIR